MEIPITRRWFKYVYVYVYVYVYIYMQDSHLPTKPAWITTRLDV